MAEPIKNVSKKDLIVAIKKEYPGINDKGIAAIMGNISLESGFKNKQEKPWSHKKIFRKHTKDGVDKDGNSYKKGDYVFPIKSIRKQMTDAGFGENVSQRQLDKYERSTAATKRSYMYWGDKEHRDHAGGSGYLQVTSADRAGMKDTKTDLEKIAKDMGYTDMKKFWKDFNNPGSTVNLTATLKLKKSSDPNKWSEDKINNYTAKELGAVINPGRDASMVSDEEWKTYQNTGDYAVVNDNLGKEGVKARQKAMKDAGIDVDVDGDWAGESAIAWDDFSTNETYTTAYKNYQRTEKAEEEGDVIAEDVKKEEEEKDIQVRVTTPEKVDPLTGEIIQEETTAELKEYGDYSTRVYDSETEQEYLVSVDFVEDEFGNVTQKVRVFKEDGKEITDTHQVLTNELTKEVVNKALSGENKFQKEGDVFYSTETGDLRENRGRFVIYDEPLVTYDPTKEFDNPDFDPKKPEGPNNLKKITKDAYIIKKDIPENKKEIINKTVEEKTKERLRKEQQQEKESIEKLRKEAGWDNIGREHVNTLNEELRALQTKQSTYAVGTPSHNKLQAQIDKKQKEVEKAKASLIKTEHEEKLALAVGEEKSARERLAKIQRDLEDDPNSHTQEEVDRAKQEVDVAVKNVYNLTDLELLPSQAPVDLPFDTSPAVILQIEQEQEEVKVDPKTATVIGAEEEEEEVVVQPEVTVTADKDVIDEDAEKKAGWFKSIGGVSTLVSGILGGIGLSQALKKPNPKDMPKLSEAFEEHLRQSKQLADQGFSPMEEAKIRRDIDGAYKTGMDNIVRGSAGDRAKFLAMSGVLDVNRSTALLDFAAKDAQAAREGRKEYGELLQYKENFEAQKSLALRTEDLQMQLESKKSGAELAKSAFAEIMDNVNNSRLNNLKGVYMQNLINDMSPVKEVEEDLDINLTGPDKSSLVWNENTKEWE